MESQEDLFRSIYNHYMPLLRWIAGRRGIPYDEIDDLVQETFTEYYDHYPLTWPEYKIRSTLTKTMRNLCIDYRRRCHTRRMVYMDPMEMQRQGMTSDRITCRDTLNIVVEHQEYRDVMNVLQNMREDWAIVFVLYIIQGRPMKEVAEILGISDAACRTRLMRGRKYLREKLEGEPPAPGKRNLSRLSEPPGTSGDSEVPGSA